MLTPDIHYALLDDVEQGYPDEETAVAICAEHASALQRSAKHVWDELVEHNELQVWGIIARYSEGCTDYKELLQRTNQSIYTYIMNRNINQALANVALLNSGEYPKIPALTPEQKLRASAGRKKAMEKRRNADD